MNKRVFRRNFFAVLVSGLAPLVFTLAIMAIVLVGLSQAEQSSRAEGVRLLEEAITRAAVHSYSINGYYPESLAYITETFGIYIDRTRFVVHYEVFASNLLPDIRVFELITR